MTTTGFPVAERGRRGYDRVEVDAFFAAAKDVFEGRPSSQPISAERIRHQAFRLKRGGYSTPHVDAALERLEDVFAERARHDGIAAYGEDGWVERVREDAQVIVNRLGRPRGQRFTHASLVTLGYNRDDVDAFAEKLLRYFREGWPITAADVRTVVFREQRGGYREDQVDAVLDAVVDVMLAVR
ncbi:MAG TPA: DivIVA domain-containing protein [Microbacteriaceae bacterium]|nr:DivIVA domain-containing protein [Microbacteriaceae bacterium]